MVSHTHPTTTSVLELWFQCEYPVEGIIWELPQSFKISDVAATYVSNLLEISDMGIEPQRQGSCFPLAYWLIVVSPEKTNQLKTIYHSQRRCNSWCCGCRRWPLNVVFVPGCFIKRVFAVFTGAVSEPHFPHEADFDKEYIATFCWSAFYSFSTPFT